MKTQLPPRRESDPFDMPRLHVILEEKQDCPLRFVVRDETARYQVKKQKMDEPKKIDSFFRTVVQTSPDFEAKKEILVLFLLNTKLECVAWSIVSKGGLDETCAHVREIFRPLLLAGEYGFAIAHNHPSGDPDPSRADQNFTRRLSESADLMQLKFMDHVVIGDKGRISEHGGELPHYFSFREAGVIC